MREILDPFHNMPSSKHSLEAAKVSGDVRGVLFRSSFVGGGELNTL